MYTTGLSNKTNESKRGFLALKAVLDPLLISINHQKFSFIFMKIYKYKSSDRTYTYQSDKVPPSSEFNNDGLSGALQLRIL